MIQNKRLVSLDVFRGLTVMLMIFVNNGAGNEIFSQLKHSKWNGLTLTDLVFPFFLFIMGASCYLSLRKSEFIWSKNVFKKVAKRTVLLFLIGMFINWFDIACDGRHFDLAHLRIMGVMQRISICYGFATVIILTCKTYFGSINGIIGCIIGILVVYSGLILCYGGYNYDSATNILARVDLSTLGYDHLYHKSPVDPEGILSTLPSIANTLLGFFISATIDKYKNQRTMILVLSGVALIVIGSLFTPLLPINKRIWSPTYALITCGIGTLLWGILVYIIDREKKSNTNSYPLQTLSIAFGTNPLFLYLVSELLAILFGSTGIKDQIFGNLHLWITNGYWASVAYATVFLSIHIILALLLFHKKILIKI